MRRKLIQLFILPNLLSLSAWLRERDEDSSGHDDEAAEALDYAIKRLQLYLDKTA